MEYGRKKNAEKKLKKGKIIEGRNAECINIERKKNEEKKYRKGKMSKKKNIEKEKCRRK
jgi:hypothetical protein